MPIEKVNAKTARYISKKMTQRGWRIARSEVITSLGQRQDAAWEQARKKGFLSVDDEERWITTPDERLCPICRPMHGRQHGIEVKTFIDNGNDKITMHPSSRRKKITWGEQNDAVISTSCSLTIEASFLLINRAATG